MALYRQEQLEALGITVPDSAAFGVDLSSHEVNVLSLSTLGAVSSQLAASSNIASGAFHLSASAATNNATVIKNAPGVLLGGSGYNDNAAGRYLKLFNKATTPNPASDVPIWTKYLLPKSEFELPSGISFSAGISFALTVGGGDTDNTSVAANDILGLNLAYR